VTSSGQRHDSLAFEPLMGQLKIARRGPGRPRTRPGRVLGDKAYSSSAIRGHLRRRGIKATIPQPADQVASRLRRGRAGGRPPVFDPAAYKQRNTVERAFGKLRQQRAVATRFDKRDFVWRGTVDVASIRIWLRDPVPPMNPRASRPGRRHRDDGPGRPAGRVPGESCAGYQASGQPLRAARAVNLPVSPVRSRRAP
jgi:transposase